MSLKTPALNLYKDSLLTLSYRSPTRLEGNPLLKAVPGSCRPGTLRSYRQVKCSLWDTPVVPLEFQNVPRETREATSSPLYKANEDPYL